jgi:hypothetical protein
VNSLVTRCRSVISRQRLFLFVGLVLFFSAVTFPFIFDRFPPGEIFRPPLIILIPVGLIVLASLCTWALVYLNPRIRVSVGWIRTHRAGAVVRITLVMIFIAACIFGIAGFSYVAGAAEGSELQSAKRDFTVVACRHISRAQVESTLVKLERGVSSLRLKYGVYYAQRHYLYLYPDVETMQRETTETSEVLGFVKYERGDPVIYLPVESVNDPLTGNRGSCTLKHEALHIVIAEMLGEHGITSIPCWFNEGLASCEGLNGQHFLTNRLRCKYELWSGETQKTPADILLADQPSNEQVNHAFYLTSSELVRYILATRGDDTPATILSSVTQGVEFEQAFKSACGICTMDMYNEWCSKYF